MTLHRKPLPVQGAWLLTDHDGKTALEWLLAAITELSLKGWRGTPLLAADGSGIDRAEFNHDAHPTYSPTPVFGEWLVLDADQLKVLSVEDCETDYAVVVV